MRRKISILGSTGSVGRNTAAIVGERGGPEAFDVFAVTGSGNIALLAEQARSLGATIAVTADESRLEELRSALKGAGVRAAAGQNALIDVASERVDWSMSAIVGFAGLMPSLRAAKNSRVLALANKESLVCAGALLRETCERSECALIPVDSEHSAIFQALRGESQADIDKVILTASGGPFRDWSRDQMAMATLQEARAHPNWDMGERISIDSATMFNKGMELIETFQLFPVKAEQIEVLVHPQSIVHSMVEFGDGAVIAHLGPTDMRGPIAFSLDWPKRGPRTVERLDLAKVARLDFASADEARFPALRLARDTIEAGGLTGVIFNAAKEIALDGFIQGRVGFLDMAALVEHVLCDLGASFCSGDAYTLDDVVSLDANARRASREWIVASS